MVLAIPTIGTHKIIVPEPKDELTQLLFADGVTLAEATINDNLVQGIIKGTAKIHIVIPDHLPQFTNNGRGGSIIMGEFYVGLLERLLEQVRDELFPHLKPQANRDKIVEVGKASDDALDIADQIFRTAWTTYDPLEQYINGKIAIGLLHTDGTYTIAEHDAERMMQETNLSEEMDAKLFRFCYKYYAGLDTMFSHNLNCRDVCMNGPRSEAVKQALHYRHL